MTDHYKVLGVEQGTPQEEVKAAFDELLAVRKARRQKTSDLHVAYAVLSDAGLRRAYDLARFGVAANDKLARTKDAAIVVVTQVRDAVPDIDLQEVARSTWQATLRAVVLATGVTAKVADVTALASRKVQSEAAKRITD